MKKPVSLRNYATIAVALLALALIAFVGVRKAETRITDLTLREDAERISHHWADYVVENLGISARVFHNDSPEHDQNMHNAIGLALPPGAAVDSASMAGQSGHAHGAQDHASDDHAAHGAAGQDREVGEAAPVISDEQMRGFHRSVHLTSIDGWAVYHADGTVIASGGTLVRSGATSNVAADLNEALASARSVPSAHWTVTDPNGRTTVHISLLENNGEVAGAIRADLNQVHTMAMVQQSLTRLSILTTLIILIAGAIGIAAIWGRWRERVSTQEELAEQNRRLDIALDNMSQGLCAFDEDMKLVVCNRQYTEMYELPREAAAPGTHFRQILEHRVTAGHYTEGSPEEYIEERLTAVREPVSSTKIQDLTDGRVVAIRHRPLDGGGWVATHDDITELQRMQDKVAHMAHHDSLTNLPNRLLLRERIDEAMQQVRNGDRFAVLCLDLDRFKSVNDTLGHPLGDELLKAVAARLVEIVDERDTIARLGGDEFAVVHVSGDSLSDTTRLAARISEAIRQPFDLKGHQVSVETSIGIAIAPDDGREPDQILKCADMALYGAKADGRGVFRFFEVEMDARMKERRALENGLREGLKRGEFEVYYQPVFSAKSREVIAFEALLRWNHPERGMIPPAEFIGVAEETGLIVQVGEWVLRQACAEAARWPGDISVAVNLSPVQFKRGQLVATVINALAASGLAASRLELEITESVLLLNNAATLETLHQMRNLGVRIAMDDFGTGYSSLSYLRSFPFDRIKIDGSFISDVSNTEEAAAIVRAVASLGSSLGMATTAEGVETPEQLERVQAEGYTDIQGFLFSPPRRAGELARLFEAEKATSAASA